MINNKVVIGEEFAYDGCHKMYVIEDEEDKKTALSYGYEEADFLPIEELQSTYHASCDLRFIHNFKLDKTYVGQYERADFH